MTHSTKEIDIDRWCDTLCHLVSFNTVSAPNTELDQSNDAAIDYLANRLSALGFECHVQTLDKLPVAKSNLYARIGSDNADGLVLSGHIDTVPANRKLWHADPWKLQRRTDRVVGLGASDMKGFFASVLAVLEQVDLSTLTRPLMVIATADEETTMYGARQLEWDRLRNFTRVVIGEPTNLRPIYAHKGVLMENIRVRGKAGHSSQPCKGINAILVMTDIINQLVEWQARLRQTYSKQTQYADFDVRWLTCNLGRIHGGDIPNRVADSCALDIDCRFFDDLRIDQVRRQIRSLAHSIADKHNARIEFDSLFDGIEAMRTDRDSPLIQTLEKLCRCPAAAVSFATEGPFFHRCIDEVAILGAGAIEVAHQPNEWVLLQNVRTYHHILSDLLDRFVYSR